MNRANNEDYYFMNWQLKYDFFSKSKWHFRVGVVKGMQNYFRKFTYSLRFVPFVREQPSAMSLHGDDLVNAVSQSMQESADNDSQHPPMDHSDNIDGKSDLPCSP